MVAERRRLSRADWAGAALRLIAEKGFGGLAVEPLAKRLGATKGSFYWHFRDRAELVSAALELWEAAGTDAVIERLGRLDDPATRLRQLLDALFVAGRPTGLSDPADAEHRELDLGVALAADTWRYPAAAEVLQRVADRRVRYLATQLAELGIPRAEAERRALLGYTAYIGSGVLLRSSAGSVAHPAATEAFVDTLQAALTEPAADGGG